MRLRVVHFGSRWFALPEKTRGSLVGSSRDGVDFGDVDLQGSVGLSRNLRGGGIREFESVVEVVAHFAPGLGRLGVAACPSP